jgi:Ca-activated chloride channel homolog
VKLKLALLFGAIGLLGIGDEDQPGWLAQALASTDKDVEAAVAAYEAEDYKAASERLDAAVARRGERAELYYDRGLILAATGDLDGARERFQNGTLSEHPQVRASSHYGLGTLALAQEDWDAAIDELKECLRVDPDHQNAKWNLELALQRKREQEKEDQEQEDQQDQDQDQQDGEDPQDQDKQDGEDPQDQDKQDGEDPQDPQPGEDQQAKAIEGGDLESALDELDRQDAFMFGRPRGAGRKVEKDW